MDNHSPWLSMVNHELQRLIMVNHDEAWIDMVNHDSNHERSDGRFGQSDGRGRWDVRTETNL